MAFVNFIEFNSDKTVAQSVRKSPLTTIHTRSGIQLLPNNELPYIQSTNVSGGIELEDVTAYIVDCKGNETDITPYFIVDRVFTNDKGEAQFDWKLTNVPFDFGYNDVYLKVEQSIGETFYSNLFRLSGYYSEKTCRIDYMNGDVMNAIQINIFFWQELKNVEIGVYYEYSTRNMVNTTVKSQRHERWTTEFVPNDLMLKLSDVFENKPVYVDLKRCYLFEAIEIKEYEAEEDFKENQIKLSFNNDDIYNPLAQPVTPQLLPEIILNSVEVTSISAIYNFTTNNFTPQSLFFQYSDDEQNWTSVEKGSTNTQFIPFNEIGTWYFRIAHVEAISNTIQLDLGNELIANDDSINIVKGGTVDVDVMFNDVLVGDVVISNVSIPANGSLQLIEGGKKVRYTHNNTESPTIDSFTYTISNGVSTSTATVKIGIQVINGSTFLMVDFGSVTNEEACVFRTGTFEEFSNEFYFTGDGSTPVLGDTVYINETLFATYNGFNEWFEIEGGKVIKINENGLIIDTAVC